jgi:hypothetical protein
MAKIVKTIPMFSAVSATRASSTYARPTGSPRFLYTSGNWAATTVTIYFEAAIKTSAGTGYAALYTAAGSVLAGSEVTTTNTTTTRVRSGAITPTTATDYEVRIKNSATNTTTIYDARIIVVLDGTITGFETHVPVQSLLATTTSTTYGTPSTGGNMLYTSANWDNLTVYYEACISNSNGANTAYCELQDNSGTSVTSSEVSIASTTYTRVRSGAITLVDAGVYWPAIKASATTARCSDARVIFIQTSPNLTESHYISKNDNSSTVSTTYVDKEGRLYWDSDEISVASATHYFESVLYIANAASTCSVELYDGSGTLVTITSTAATRARVRSSSMSPVDNTEYITRLKTSNASHSAASIAPKIISVITIASGGTSVKDILGMGFIPFAR